MDESIWPNCFGGKAKIRDQVQSVRLSEQPLDFLSFMLTQHKLGLFSLATTLLLSNAAHAGLLGDYDRISGGSACPTGVLGFDDPANDGSRALRFGNRHTWPMTMKNRSVVNDGGKNQCTYVWATDLSKNRFTSKTTRTQCPSADHNDVVTETMILHGKIMTYDFSSKDERFKCRYRKR